MVAKEIRRERLWQAIHDFTNTRSTPVIRLYFSCTDTNFESLPLVFEQQDYRLPRLFLEEAALNKAMSLSEPNRTNFVATAKKNTLLSLGTACNRYFGPLCRPGRTTHLYNAYNELHFSVEEIEALFSDIRNRFYQGSYIRIEQLASLYFGKQMDEELTMAEESSLPYKPAQHFSLNQILYGPPGTGKTFHAISYAVAIIEGRKLSQILEEDRQAIRKRYEEYKNNEQIEFITFHQSYAYEDFVQGLRPNVNHNTENLHFKLVDGVFKRIADRAKANYASYRQNASQPKASFEVMLDRLLMERMNRETEEVELPVTEYQGQFKSIIIYEVGDTYLKYKRRSLRDAVKEEERLLYIHKLKEKYEGREIRDAINKQYYETVVNAVKKFERKLKYSTDGGQLKNYVLIIDEINRANISRVFGELITLLEEDKRCGQENEMTVTLPSGESFTVPTNLYIIGTMNTADKSIALLDVALRRRFEFIAMYPDYSQIPEFASILEPLNEKIREKKGADFMIGHSFFIGKTREDIPAILNRKIIPLLHEYFNNRTEQIKEVLKASGLEVAEENYQLVVKGSF